MKVFSFQKAINVKNLHNTVLTFVFMSVAMSQSLLNAQLTADFSLDSNNFFSNNSEARAAVEAAVADLNAALNQNLAAITMEDQTVSGSFQSATVDITLSARVEDPSNSDPVDVSVVSPQSVVRIFYGARSLGTANAEDADTLGVGGPGAWSFRSSVEFSNVNDIGPAATNAGNATSLIYLRGEGPLISLFNSSFNIGEGENAISFPYQLNLGLAHGAVSFNNSTSNFHFDHTTPVAFNEVDFYSVALHETMHAVGMGPSDEWASLVSGTSWIGPEVIRLRGGGAGVVAADGDHVSPDVVSPRLIEGRLQRSVLAPAIPSGLRLELTELDLAFMRDLGFAEAVVPPPEALLGDFDLDGDVDLADLDRYNSMIGSAAVSSLAELDLNGNRTVDLLEFETLYTRLVETSNGEVGTFAGDVDLDGNVTVLGDAFALIGNLGSQTASSWSQGDLNADGAVDVLNDAFLLIGNLGASNE